MIIGHWWNLLTGETEVLGEKLGVEERVHSTILFYMPDWLQVYDQWGLRI